MSGHHSSSMSHGSAKDPVCGMSVDPGSAKWSSEHAGAKYYFCGRGCKDSFEKDPAAYLK